jgi:hypothetical protein
MGADIPLGYDEHHGRATQTAEDEAVTVTLRLLRYPTSLSEKNPRGWNSDMTLRFRVSEMCV